jgi:small subunit ribosomal protein S8
MTMTDPIADMLTRIRNGLKARHDAVDIPGSKQKISIARVLKGEGYIKNYKTIADGRQGILRVFLRYDEKGSPVIRGLKRTSKPSRRIYAGRDELPKVLNGYGISIVSTSKGIMTDGQAKKTGVGGEILCSIW